MPTMFTPRVITGELVDIISPFPPSYIDRLVKWTHQYKSLITDDFNIKTDEEMATTFIDHIENGISYGVVDKHNKIGLPIDGPVVVGGFFMENGGSPANIYIHTVSQRRAWGKGLMDEGAALTVADLFEQNPLLQRLSAYMVSTNKAIIHFAEKQGFRREGLLRDMTKINGELRDVILYGLTKRYYNEIIQPPAVIESE